MAHVYGKNRYPLQREVEHREGEIKGYGNGESANFPKPRYTRRDERTATDAGKGTHYTSDLIEQFYFLVCDSFSYVYITNRTVREKWKENILHVRCLCINRI